MKVIDLIEKEWKYDYMRYNDYVVIGIEAKRDSKKFSLNAKQLIELTKCEDFKSITSTALMREWSFLINTKPR